MTVVRSIFRDLVDRRLWPVAVALVAALVAVPLLLGRGDAGATDAGPRTAPLPPAAGSAVSVATAGNTRARERRGK